MDTAFASCLPDIQGCNRCASASATQSSHFSGDFPAEPMRSILPGGAAKSAETAWFDRQSLGRGDHAARQKCLQRADRRRVTERATFAARHQAADLMPPCRVDAKPDRERDI